MANEQYEVLDWDVELDEGDDSSGFKLLEEGFYQFKVVGAKKTYTNGKPSYPCVDLSLKVGEGPNSATVSDRIAMHSGMKWKIAQLSVCLGARKHGEKKSFNPAETVGMAGWLEIEHREFEFTRGEKMGQTGLANNVARYLDPEDAPVDGRPVVKQGGGDAAEDEW
jgi:hypothetical protein